MDEMTEPHLLPPKKGKKAKRARGKSKAKKGQGRRSWIDRAGSATTGAVLAGGLAVGAVIGALVGRRR